MFMLTVDELLGAFDASFCAQDGVNDEGNVPVNTSLGLLELKRNRPH